VRWEPRHAGREVKKNPHSPAIAVIDHAREPEVRTNRVIVDKT